MRDKRLLSGPPMSRLSSRLDMPLNAPVAIVQRSVVDRSGCLVFIGEGLYRGDMVRIDMKLR